MKGIQAVGLLYIASNIQTIISTDEHDHLAKIEDLSNKGSTSVPNHLNPDITYLRLDQNNIDKLTNLQKYPKLQYLSVNKNQITTNDDLRGIRSARNLLSFEVSDNNLLTLNLATFHRNSKLKDLIVDGNLHIIIHGSIPTLPRLWRLSFRYCNLASLPWLDFSGVPRLKILELVGNPIREIPEEAIRSLPNGVKLVIDDELCHILTNRADVKDKMIKLSCSAEIPNVSKILSGTDEFITNSKPQHTNDDNNKDKTNYVICILIALLFVVLCAIEIVTCRRHNRRLPQCNDEK